MVHVTDAQIAQYKADGYLIVPAFLTPEESAAALDGFWDNFAGPYDDWVEQGSGPSPTHGGFAAKPRVQNSAVTVFPWGSAGLNLCTVHPHLIDACERIIGTANIRLCEAHCGIKYAMEEGWKQSGKRDPTQADGFHQDFGNNTIGPGSELV
jgi:hypothetical protein